MGEQVMDAIKDGQSWLDSNPEAEAEEVKEKHKEIEGICAPMFPSITDKVVVEVGMMVMMRMRMRHMMSCDVCNRQFETGIQFVQMTGRSVVCKLPSSIRNCVAIQ